MSDLISTADAAKILGVSQRRVQVLVKSGRLKSEMIAGRAVLKRSTVAAFQPMPQGWQPGVSRSPKKKSGKNPK